MNQSPATNWSSRNCEWESPPAFPVLSNDEVHVWQAGLDEENAADLEILLSDEERARAGRFRVRRQRKDFIVARGLLRIILAKYLNTHPGQLAFEYSQFGKPSVRQPSSDNIRFNVAHSDGVALYAVTRNREIGIDLERIKPFLLDERTVAECLTATEVRLLKSLPAKERQRFFFECWTRKESYLKARGVGLMSPPNQIETCLPSEPSAATGFTEYHEQERQAGWSFQDPPPIPAFAAALVVEGSGARSNYWRL
jgi:4'-phosphopantetheinyl transferase